MRLGARLTFLGISALSLLLAGCAQIEPREDPPKTEVAPPRPEPVQPPPPPAALGPAEERRLVEQLLGDVEQYYRLLQEKNAEGASAYVDSEHRRAHEDELWEFVAKYKIESADVMSYELFPQPDLVTAKVKVLRTMFRRDSVKPQRSEQWMTWEYRQGRWVLQPARSK